MSTRIPASLNWLVNKRARLNGKILRTQKALEEAQRLGVGLSAELSKLYADMEVIDRALQMHEIQVHDKAIPILVRASGMGASWARSSRRMA